MQGFACKTCSITVKGKSEDAQDCTGDFPFWNCCNCAAVHAGWSGWERRACPQCRGRDDKVSELSGDCVNAMIAGREFRKCHCLPVRYDERIHLRPTWLT